MLIIRHKRCDCIGCALCVELAPSYWSISAEGLAQLRQVVSRSAPFDIARGFEDDHELLQAAADQCPVKVIRIARQAP